jgi:hypothetical protein
LEEKRGEKPDPSDLAKNYEYSSGLESDNDLDLLVE